MLGFKLGFGVASVLFGPSARGPVEVLADLGGAIDFNTKKEHFSLRAGVPKNNAFNIQKSFFIVGTDKSCGPPSFRGPFEAFEGFWWLLAPLGGFLGP